MQTSNSRTKHRGGDPANKNSFLTPSHWSKLPDKQIPKLLQFVVCFRTNIWRQNKLDEVTCLWLEEASRSNSSNSWRGLAGLSNALITHPKLPIFEIAFQNFSSGKNMDPYILVHIPDVQKLQLYGLWCSEHSAGRAGMPRNCPREVRDNSDHSKPLLNCPWGSAREQEFWAWNCIQQAWEN